ncbi:endothelin-converting enzyme homolog isoform X2 [Procambarus clarkii]
MNTLNSFRRQLSPDTADDERQPIMTPVDHPTRQSRDATRNNQSPNGIELSTNYNTIQVAPPLPTGTLQDPGGGYLGPAALLQEPPGPASDTRSPTTDHEGAVTAPRPGTDPGRSRQGPAAPPPLSWRRRGSSYTLHQGPGVCGWWVEGTPPRERVLVLTISALTLLVLTLATALLALSLDARRGSDVINNTCLSAECVKTAGDILRSLNEDVSPCENFAEFACGGWRRENPIPEGRFRWGVFNVLDQQTLLDLRGMLEEEPGADEPFPITASKTIYQACVNDSMWEKVGLRPLLDLLGREGGLPMLEPEWTGEGFQVMRSLAALRRRLASQSLVSLTVGPDSLNTSISLIYLSEGLLPLRRSYLIPDTPNASFSSVEHKASQITYMRMTGEELLKEAGKLGNRTHLTTLYNDIDDLWQFYVQVAEITSSSPLLEDPWEVYNPIPVKELQALTDAVNSSFKVDWVSYLTEVFEGTNITISREELVVVDRPEYFAKLVRLLQHVPPRTIANYLLFPVVVDMGEETTVRYLANPSDVPFRRPSVRSLGRSNSRPWQDCSEKTRMLVPLAVTSLYVRRRKEHPNGTHVEQAREIVEDVSAAFRNMLSSASWMDNETQQAALKKLDHMQHLVAFPDLVWDDHLLEEYHLGMPKVSASDHFGNMASLVAWHSLRSLLHLREPPPAQEWPRGPMETNAFYSPLHNTIVIPTAVLQPPIFHLENLRGLNYGSLGSIIGHEITHGFDNNGRHRDWSGALKHWWTNQTLQQYANRTNCFVDQYSAYDAADLLPPHHRPSKGMKINGAQTKGENVADNDGLRAAWAAYRTRLQKDSELLKLPGLEHYTPDQLFFIGFGKVWCSRHSLYALRFLLEMDAHSPADYRILGPLHNSPEFSAAFNCVPGSPMNPSRKCVLW